MDMQSKDIDMSFLNSFLPANKYEIVSTTYDVKDLIKKCISLCIHYSCIFYVTGNINLYHF